MSKPLYKASQMLHIAHVNIDDDENVYCQAENSVGHVTSFVNLHVLCNVRYVFESIVTINHFSQTTNLVHGAAAQILHGHHIPNQGLSLC